MPISWEDARRRIAERMAGLTDKSRFLMVTQPLRGHQALLVSEFVKEYGGRSMAFEAMEQVTLRRAILDVFGQERLPVFDIKECKYLLSFGADFLSTWLSPVKYSRGYGELRQGSGRRGLHVQVDPRFSMTAANADEWVPVRPGGEGVLAMSMAYVIIRDGLGDPGAVSALTGGGGHEALAAFSPENQQVRDVTGVEPGRIEELARAFADPKQPAEHGHRGRLRGRTHQRPLQPSRNLLAQSARGQREHARAASSSTRRPRWRSLPPLT